MKITITDAGCGMKKEDLENLFQQFIQVNEDSLKRNIGSGLGLYITKEIVMKLQGQIKVFSKPNKGSVFIICLPTVSMNPIENTNQRPQDLSELRIKENLKLLVVDDVLWNAQVFVNYLNRLKVKTALATNGLEAVEKYQEAHNSKEPFDAILMDYDMPVMTGKEALIQIRKYEKSNNLKPCTIIIVSGHVDERIINECLAAPRELKADYFIRKPVTFEQLQQVLSKV